MNLDWYQENKVSPDYSIGVDEVGRGPLAGPVVAAAVWISLELAIRLKDSDELIVRDSKKMTKLQREKVVNWMQQQHPELLRYSVGQATVEEIDRLNILNAALLAMERAYNFLGIHKKYVLVDGNRTPDLKNTETSAVVRGDDKVLSISLASIVAKEHRDAIMRKLAIEHPHYGWETNVGYGSQQHLQAILMHGITRHHRKTFCKAIKRRIASFFANHN
ncbi:MAG: ribonuclease HII [Holosporaceae bacterium]|jgi:ribonuclease HII|nr:ribonuclease HII [Holosporaceae bacterium]